ncbi:PREDICTED: late embryogenesis abundant protein D-11 [Theobroma cacao]|uniref:Late embryogenesis abundant protein D-11 n=1 Tax=Theobroma cacao TaxID=3641 RepID=A0AB32WV10_THECC|nr:PREDICTED: late embryogenesis abundant protein D-11 [Theobroma cacao]
MAHFQNQHPATEVSQSDEFGNPVRQTDKYGNPIAKHKTGRGIAGIGGHHHGLHRTDSSSSSSSSEDEGTGRKRKGLKDKLKEKLPGGHKDQHQPHPAASTTTPGQQHEKNGMMD